MQRERARFIAILCLRSLCLSMRGAAEADSEFVDRLLRCVLEWDGNVHMTVKAVI